MALCSDASEEYLERTIIFKVNPGYRHQCFDNTVDIDALNSFVQQLGAVNIQKMFPNKRFDKALQRTDLSLIYSLTYDHEVSVFFVIAQFEQWDFIAYAEPYYIPTLTYTPNDTMLNDGDKAYHLEAINAFDAWDIQQGDTNVVIGITDTGWDPNHPDLQDNVKVNYDDPINGIDDDNDGYVDNFMGWDLGEDDNDASFESSSHGVHVTGIAAAVTDNITGIAGVGFNTKFLPIKISNSSGVLTHAYQGIIYAADQGCTIINCSWGSYSFSLFRQDIIDYAVKDKGCLIVAGAGNDGSTRPFYPASYPGVISVGSSDENDLKAELSNYGTNIDIVAPGLGVWSTDGFGAYGFRSGTSMSAPMVAGAAAIAKAQFPNYTNQQIGALLQASAQSIDDTNANFSDSLGSGRLDVLEALTSSDPKYIDMVSVVINESDNDGSYDSGETLEIVGEFINYLSPVENITLQLTCSSPSVQIVNGFSELSDMQGLSSTTNSPNPFVVKLLSTLEDDEEVNFSVEITADGYSEKHFFSILVNPSYVNIDVNEVSMSITNDSRLGHTSLGNGLGFTYKRRQLLFGGYFMVGSGDGRLVDQFNTSNTGFTPYIDARLDPPYVSDIDVYSAYFDSDLSEPLNIFVHQNTYAFEASPDDKYIIISYGIENVGDDVLTDVYAGIYTNWGVISSNLNQAFFDADLKLGYTRYLGEDSMYVGVKVLSANMANGYCIDRVVGGAGGIDVTDDFTKEEKYFMLSNNRFAAGGESGNDVAQMVSSGGVDLQPGARMEVAFALLAGDSLTDLLRTSDAAQAKFDSGILLKNQETPDEGVIVYPNPTTGQVALLARSTIQSVHIYNLYGKELYSSNDSETTLDLSTFSRGIYFMGINTEAGKQIEKIILQ